MNVKLTVPTNLDDVTVGQQQAITLLLDDESLVGSKLDDEILKIVLNYSNIDGINAKDRVSLINDVRIALESEGTFKQTFKLNGVEYGLIPNFDSISNGEYVDLIKYSESDLDLHRLMAVAYRPVKFNLFRWLRISKDYDIEEYDGTSEHAENMKELPMSIAKGVIGFFLTLSKDLEIHIQRSMEAEQVKGMTR